MSTSKGISSNISEDDVAKLVMGYLNESGLHDALIAMQLSLGFSDKNFGEELRFLQQSVLHGRWDDALAYIQPFRKKTSRYNEVKSGKKKNYKLATKVTHYS